MKEIKRMKEITITREETMYVCEANGCKFETVWESAARKHAASHLKLKSHTIGHMTFIWFETIEEAETWCDGQRDFYDAKNFHGPMWYGIKNTTRSYSNGDSYGVELVLPGNVKDEWEQERDQIANNMAKMDELLK